MNPLTALTTPRPRRPFTSLRDIVPCSPADSCGSSIESLPCEVVERETHAVRVTPDCGRTARHRGNRQV